jgi:hypothetical protein
MEGNTNIIVHAQDGHDALPQSGIVWQHHVEVGLCR